MKTLKNFSNFFSNNALNAQIDEKLSNFTSNSTTDVFLNKQGNFNLNIFTISKKKINQIC